MKSMSELFFCHWMISDKAYRRSTLTTREVGWESGFSLIMACNWKIKRKENLGFWVSISLNLRFLYRGAKMRSLVQLPSDVLSSFYSKPKLIHENSRWHFFQVEVSLVYNILMHGLYWWRFCSSSSSFLLLLIFSSSWSPPLLSFFFSCLLLLILHLLGGSRNWPKGPPTLTYVHSCFPFLCLFVWDRVSLCHLACPGTHYVD